jgi:hypothetical protein
MSPPRAAKPEGFIIADMTLSMELVSFLSANSEMTGTVTPMAAPKVMSRIVGIQTPNKQYKNKRSLI